jgi:hypothetical protein
MGDHAFVLSIVAGHQLISTALRLRHSVPFVLIGYTGAQLSSMYPSVTITILLDL